MIVEWESARMIVDRGSHACPVIPKPSVAGFATATATRLHFVRVSSKSRSRSVRGELRWSHFTRDHERRDDAVDIASCRRQEPFIEGAQSIAVHLHYTIRLSNEPEPPRLFAVIEDRHGNRSVVRKTVSVWELYGKLENPYPSPDSACGGLRRRIFTSSRWHRDEVS